MKIPSIFVFTFLLLLSTSAFAKRSAPKELKPVVVNGIQYSVPHFASKKRPTMAHPGGYLEAKDLKRKKILWVSEVYSVTYVPGMETDVQDVFITSIVPQGKNLIITDEKNRLYSFPLAQ